MRDSSRPTPSRSVSSPIDNISSSLLHRSPLTTNYLQRLDRKVRGRSVASDTWSQLDEESSPFQPWGNVRARGGRGDLALKGLSACSQRETTLATTLIASAWAAGECGLDGLAWPEENSGAL